MKKPTTSYPNKKQETRNKKLFLRALEPDDLDFLFALENDAEMWAVTDTLAPVSRHALREYLAHAGADFYEVRQLRLVICDARAAAEEGEAGSQVGTLDIFDFNPLHRRAGVGIALQKDFRGRGLARQALALLLPYARHTLGLHQLYATVGADNVPSLKLFEAAGFRQVGVRKGWLRDAKTGRWRNAVEWQYVFEETQ